MRYSLKSAAMIARQLLESAMPIKEDLLEILCCPKSMERLKVVGPDAVARINDRIAAGQVHLENGAEAKEPIEEALVTVDAKRVYVVKDSIPVMLIDESIPAGQLGEEIVALLCPDC